MAAGNIDVIILGTGFSGSILGAILSRHGRKILLIDEKKYPKFAVGEATIPQTTMMMPAIADRYDIPEIGACSTFEGMHEHVTSYCGIKSTSALCIKEKVWLTTRKKRRSTSSLTSWSATTATGPSRKSMLPALCGGQVRRDSTSKHPSARS